MVLIIIWFSGFSGVSGLPKSTYVDMSLAGYLGSLSSLSGQYLLPLTSLARPATSLDGSRFGRHFLPMASMDVYFVFLARLGRDCLVHPRTTHHAQHTKYAAAPVGIDQ
ncbi:hypothetical protein F4778DRAFT_438428 [Xylariomycetidae sp. FL2044]|nr:hypothetical protein F4778DRAFT_438428 [Xylariomycetidae sp. FL2044]